MLSTQEEIPSIGYSPARVRGNGGSLSHIHSHTQSFVQRRRRPETESNKKNRHREDSVEIENMRRASTKSMQLDGADSSAAARHGRDSEDQRLAKLALPLSGGCFEPFKAFAVEINQAFVDHFERYHRGYRWDAYKPGLFLETASDPALYHSFMAVAYNLFPSSKVKAIEHETEAIHSISKALKDASLDKPSRKATKESLTWAISRLAMIRSQQGDWNAALKHINACALTCRSIEDIAGYKFASHIQCTHSVLLLANLGQIDGINTQLRRPYGDSGLSALADVEAEGYKLPLASLLSLRDLNIDSQLLDILCALIALCHPATRTPVYHDTLGINQAVNLLKLAVRLAEMFVTQQNDCASKEPPKWRIELQACMRLTALLFILCPSPATDAACKEVRQRLTNVLLDQIAGCRPQTEKIRPRSSAASILLLWILMVCSVSAQQRGDQSHFSSLIKEYYPYVADASESAMENWRLSIPMLRVGSDSPVDVSWRLSNGDSEKTSARQVHCVDTRSTDRPKCAVVNLKELASDTFSIEDEFLSF